MTRYGSYALGHHYAARNTSKTGACPICLTGFVLHFECGEAALAWILTDDPDMFGIHSQHLVYRLGATCYLCGTAPTTQADHVHPVARGGSTTWSNMGGSCAPCNARKSDKLLTLTSDQRARLDAQHAAFRAAHARASWDIAAAYVSELADHGSYQFTWEGDPTPTEWLEEGREEARAEWLDEEIEGRELVGVAAERFAAMAGMSVTVRTEGWGSIISKADAETNTYASVSPSPRDRE